MQQPAAGLDHREVVGQLVFAYFHKHVDGLQRLPEQLFRLICPLLFSLQRIGRLLLFLCNPPGADGDTHQADGQ